MTAAWDNAKLAVLSALPGVIPFTDVLLPATALGDMVLLTRNQVFLLLRIAAAYGQEVDLRARVRELLPVVGSAFGWRALARELLGLVPGGIGVVDQGRGRLRRHLHGGQGRGHLLQHRPDPLRRAPPASCTGPPSRTPSRRVRRLVRRGRRPAKPAESTVDKPAPLRV